MARSGIIGVSIAAQGLRDLPNPSRPVAYDGQLLQCGHPWVGVFPPKAAVVVAQARFGEGPEVRMHDCPLRGESPSFLGTLCTASLPARNAPVSSSMIGCIHSGTSIAPVIPSHPELFAGPHQQNRRVPPLAPLDQGPQPLGSWDATASEVMCTGGWADESGLCLLCRRREACADWGEGAARRSQGDPRDLRRASTSLGKDRRGLPRGNSPGVSVSRRHLTSKASQSAPLVCGLVARVFTL